MQYWIYVILLIVLVALLRLVFVSIKRDLKTSRYWQFKSRQLVSIVLRATGKTSEIEETVERIANSTHRYVELTILNDSKSQKTATTLRSIQTRYRSRFKNLRIVSAEQNKKPARLIRTLRGSTVIYLNTGDHISKHFVQYALRRFKYSKKLNVLKAVENPHASGILRLSLQLRQLDMPFRNDTVFVCRSVWLKQAIRQQTPASIGDLEFKARYDKDLVIQKKYSGGFGTVARHWFGASLLKAIEPFLFFIGVGMLLWWGDSILMAVGYLLFAVYAVLALSLALEKSKHKKLFVFAGPLTLAVFYIVVISSLFLPRFLPWLKNNSLIRQAPTILAGLTLVVSVFGASYLLLQSYGIFQNSSITGADLAVLGESQVIEAETPKPNTTISQIETTTPNRLVFPSIDFTVDVIDSTIPMNGKDWPLSNTKAHYANFTPGLGSLQGTMLMYGHNQWSILRNTANLKIGDKMIVIDENEKPWEFILTREAIIKPNEIGFIYEDVSFRAVVFTCDGWDSANRRLMFFEPVSE